MQDGVALGEGGAAGVLTGQADRHALHEQAPQGDELPESPVDAALAGGLAALGEHGLELGVDGEGLGPGDLGVADALDDVARHGRGPAEHHAGARPLGVGDLQGGQGHAHLRGVRQVLCGGVGGVPGVVGARAPGDLDAGLGEDPLQLVLVALGDLLGLLRGDVAASHEGGGVDAAGGVQRVDEPVHERLGHRGVVALVVAAPPVADEVDDDVLVEGASVLVGVAGGAGHRLGVVGVDVEDRHLQALGQVGGVDGGAGRGRAGGEADLVVDDDVDGAAGAVGGQLAHVEGLVDHALAGEGGVTVDEDRHDRVALLAQADAVLLGAHDALDDAVDRLQVGGVGGQGDAGGHAVGPGEDAHGAQVVLDVPGAGALDDAVALELVEDLAVGLAGDVGEHVEAAAVGHADDDLVEAVVGGGVEQAVQGHDEGLPALEAEALLAHVLGLQEGLEGLGLLQLGEDPTALLVGDVLPVALEALLPPGALGRVLDVHVLHAHGAAVGVAQHPEDLAQGCPVAPAQAPGGEGAVQVPQAQPVGGDVQVGVAAQAVGERVVVGRQVAALAVGVDELGHARRLAGLQLGVVGGVAHPLDRLEGDAQGLEGPVPEAVQSQELALHQAQELAGGGALDDAVVVGGGQGDDLADGLAGQGVGAGAGEGGRVVHGADPDDEPLTGHEARHRVQGADHAGVGQGHGGTPEVVKVQLVLAGLGHEGLVGLHELGQVHEVGLLDGGHQQAALPVGAGHVDGQAEGHVGRLVQDRLAGLVDPVGDVH